jgi:hypothetical protein
MDDANIRLMIAIIEVNLRDLTIPPLIQEMDFIVSPFTFGCRALVSQP